MKIISCDCVEHNALLNKRDFEVESISPFLINDKAYYKAYIIYRTKGVGNPKEIKVPIDYCPFCGKKIEIGE